MYPASLHRHQGNTTAPCFSLLNKRRFLFLGFLIFFFNGAFAQAPSSLQYPASSAYIANVSNVYLAPTLAGSTAGLGYTISPALPTGLSFNTGTGVISGVPTVASTPTTYTVTATNSVGSTSTTFIITITTSYFNNASNQVSFPAASCTFKVGDGTNVGDVAVYANVATIGGQALDCIVKTVSITNNSSWFAYDQSAVTDNATYNSNDDKFFSPFLNFAGAGEVTFDFQFILGGTYVNATNPGTKVTLQNVALNSYDIDGNGSANSNQFNEFSGFTKSELGSSTTLSTPSYDPATGMTKFMSATSVNNTTVTADATRVRLTYSNMSHFRIQMGAGASGRAYFFFDFSVGSTFTTATPSFPPTLDLNTTLTGTSNNASGCATALSFSASGQTNVASGANIEELNINYANTTTNLPDGASETLFIAGSTAGTATHALNFSGAGTSSVTVGGVAYTITKSVSGTNNTISFTNGSTFTVAQAEALLDALQYSNSASFPTSGSRVFTVTVRDSKYISPDAEFTASLNCVSIAGNLYHDANGLSDNTINATGSTMGQFGANAAYVVLTNAATDAVLSTKPIAAGGAYTFGRQNAGAFNVFISNTATPGATMTTSTYPTGNYKTVGENLGITAGTDGLADSKMTLSLGTVAVTNANLGLQIPPVTTPFAASNQANPGGYNFYTLPSAAFAATDADGSVQNIVISSFPTGANYLKIGSTIYTNGGNCPPQSTCTAWPGTVTIPFSSAGTISVDPSSAGNTTVSIDYTVTDNANFTSNSSTISIPFTVPATPLVVSGTVWNDANGNGIKEAGEGLTAAASSGQTLYALLVQTTNTYSTWPTVYASAPVSATTGYTFSGVPAGNDYEVRIVSLANTPTDGVARSTIAAALATGYTGISTNNNGTIAAYQNTNNLVNSLSTVSADKVSVGFGIERAPDTQPVSTIIAHPAANSFVTLSGGSNPPFFTGSDPEDQPSNATLSGKTVAITLLPTKGQLWYNGVQITKGADNLTVPSLNNPFKISNFDPTKMQIKFTGTGYTSISFNYAYIDAANMIDPTPASYALNWAITLPVHLTSFTAKASGSAALLAWTTRDEVNMKEFVVEKSTNTIDFSAIATIVSKGGTENTYHFTDDQAGSAPLVLYRLKQMDNDGQFTYSTMVSVSFAKENGLTFTINPNPVTGPLKLTINSNGRGSGVLRISDYAGKTFVRKTITLNAGVTTLALENDVHLSNGIYLLSLEANGEVKTQRFIVQR